MRYSIFILWLALWASTASISAQEVTWARRLGDTGYDKINVLLTDANANVYVAGVFADTLNTTGGNIISDGLANDVFFGQYNSEGDLIWLRRLGGDGADRVTAMALSNTETLYLAGTVLDTVRFGTDTIVTKNTADSDIYLSKIDAVTGDFIWTKEIETALEGNVADIATDALGNVFVWGNFEDSLVLGTDSLLAFGQNDCFLLKYDSNGNLLWKNHFGGTKNDLAVGLSVSATGDCYLTGTFNGKILFGSTFLESYNNADSFVARYDSEGNLVWAKQTQSNELGALVTDIVQNENGVFITGTYSNNTLVNGQILLTEGLQSVFVARYLTDGSTDWVRGFGGDLIASPTQVVSDANQHLYLSGIVAGSVFFDTHSINSPLGQNAWAASVNSQTGSAYWALSWGGEDYDVASGIAVADGKCFVGGAMAQSAVLGNVTVSSAGNLDAVLLQISQDVIIGISDPTPITLSWNSYPNPATNYVRLQIADEPSHHYTVRVANVLGQSMWTGNVDNQAMIDIATWQRGLYLLQLYRDGQYVGLRQLIVQ